MKITALLVIAIALAACSCGVTESIPAAKTPAFTSDFNPLDSVSGPETLAQIRQRHMDAIFSRATIPRQ